MIRFIAQRILVLLVRLCLVAVIVTVVAELSYGVLGNSDKHVWAQGLSDPVEPLIELTGRDGWQGIVPLMIESLHVVVLAWLVALLVGYTWGILSVRLRRFRGQYILMLPWAILACIPGFWWVIQIAIYSYFQWERPGFANEVVVESGPDVMRWWNIAVTALPLGVFATSLQLREVAQRVREEISLPFVRGLRRAGYSESEIFYRHILKRLTGDLVRLSDRVLPLILGGLVFVEAAFRFEGIGNFLIRSLELNYFPGILFSSLWMAALIALASLLRELAVHLLSDD